MHICQSGLLYRIFEADNDHMFTERMKAKFPSVGAAYISEFFSILASYFYQSAITALELFKLHV